MSLARRSQSDPDDPRLVAAVIAAVQAYMESEVSAEPPSPRISAWNHAARSWQAGDQFGRQISWRGID
ncbi:MAG: hypothetical protein IIC24_09500 [Chloroflexi bacterium]|nr:hypothetical protein [Chloroflexota bacterium]MCH8310579.1 hypothetical protein [Chloroflexota bacterium]